MCAVGNVTMLMVPVIRVNPNRIVQVRFLELSVFCDSSYVIRCQNMMTRKHEQFGTHSQLIHFCSVCIFSYNNRVSYFLMTIHRQVRGPTNSDSFCRQ